MSLSFSWSRAGDSAAQRPAKQEGAQQTVSVSDQLQRIRDAWDPRSPNCAFQHYFYNQVPPEQAPLYTLPPGQDPVKWESAVAARPDASSVPVLAVGFDDLNKRIEQQRQQVNAYRVRMHEINTKLTDVQNRHDLRTTVKLAEMRERHAKLSRRILALAVKLHVLTRRGEQLSPREELFRRKLEADIKRADDPSVFGSLNEVRARVKIAAEQISPASKIGEGEDFRGFGSNIRAEASNDGPGDGTDDDRKKRPVSEDEAMSWERTSTELEHIIKVLAAQQAGIQFLANLLREDSEALDPRPKPDLKQAQSQTPASQLTPPQFASVGQVPTITSQPVSQTTGAFKF